MKFLAIYKQYFCKTLAIKNAELLGDTKTANEPHILVQFEFLKHHYDFSKSIWPYRAQIFRGIRPFPRCRKPPF